MDQLNRAFFRFKCRDDVHSVTRAIARNKKTVPVKMKKLSQVRRNTIQERAS